jgi:Domain of unknown function (DUF5916)/Carbohydrate family 9 binding domain-like
VHSSARSLLFLLIALGSDTLLAQDENNSRSIEIHPAPPVPPAIISRDENGRVTLRATRIAEPIVLDGKLDESVYSRVPAVSDFVQQEPHEGEPATEKTEAWVFFDDENIYVSARCWDSHPERMVINEMRRDNFNIYQNENVTLVFDTFYDRRNGFFFQTNPLGALRDQAVGDEGQVNNQDWNTVWDVKASVFDQGWMVEIEIPFKSLRYREGRDQIWSFNLRRSIRWKNEETFLSPVAASHRFRGIYKFSEAATLVGIEAPLGARSLEMKPYGIATAVTDRTTDPPQDNDLDADAGVDVKYGLTPGLITDFTYNTDFAQVEEDQEQVNLTRFSLFFPEKRDFFLEGQAIFTFGGVELRGGNRSSPGDDETELTPIPFFSRRIGLTEAGVDPILAGGRLTGRAGAYRIGAINIQTRGVDGTAIEPTNFSVLRLRRDIFGRSDIGVLATHRTTSPTAGADENSLLGVDANFSFFTNLRASAFYTVSRTSLAAGGVLGGNDSSYRAHLEYGGERYGLILQHLLVGESFKPEMGFLSREAFRRSLGQARYSPRPDIAAIRRFVFQGEIDYIEGEPTGILETRRLQGQFQIDFQNSDEARVEYNRQYEFLPADFEISEGVILPVGGYDFDDVRFVYSLGPQRPVSGEALFRTGTFFGGDREQVAFFGRVDISPRFSVEPGFEFNWIDLPQGKFRTDLVSSRFNWTLSPRTAIITFLQYNSSTDSLSSSVRLRWEYEPGSDFYAVYTDGRATDVNGFPLLESRTFALKFTKLFRF